MLTRKQLTRKIAGIAKRNATLRGDIQETLLNTAGHVLEHRDVSLFTLLFNSVVGQDRLAIASWVQDYGLARLDAKTGSFKLNNKAWKECDCESGDEYIDRLRDTAPDWFALVADTDAIVKALDVAKRIEATAKALDKALKEGKAVAFNSEAIEAARKHLSRSLDSAERMIAMQQGDAPAKDVTPAPLMIAAQ